jgi:branched-chain amino acid transport system permease protein
MAKETSFRWSSVIQTGLLGGIAALFVSLVGMVEEFGKRDIVGGVITMGQTILFVAILFAGYMAASRAVGKPRWLAALCGGLAGLIAGAMLSLLVLLIGAFNLRAVLINASPGLVHILTFGKEGSLGFLYLLGAGAIIGAVASLLQVLPVIIRRGVILGLAWVALLGLLQDLIRVTLTNLLEVGLAVGWMFGSKGVKGMTVNGAVAVFLVIGAANYLSATQGNRIRQRVQTLPETQRYAVRWGTLALALGVVLYLPNLLGSYLSEVANSTGLFILMGLGLNIVVGFAGLLDLGYVAFYAIGAYTMGVLTTISGEIAWAPHLSFWTALPAAIFMSLLFGVLLGIPVLKMRGDYLAIVTLGFGEIIRILALSDFLKPYIGGSQGIVQVTHGNVIGFDFDIPQRLYYLILVGILLTAFIAWRLRDSRLGRTWKAMREDEDVAQAMGINLVATKLLAFGTGAAFAGLGGAIFASKLGTIYPHSFSLLISINVLALIIVGGMGSLPGVFVGALVLAGLPELLREFAEFRLLIYGALLILMMQLKPEGFWPEATHKRELHDEFAEGAPQLQTPVLKAPTK